MEQILPVLERQLRCFRRHAAWLSAAHPRLARQLSPASAGPDAHVDRLAQGVASLHARSVLALQRAGWQQDEHLLELHFPGQLRPFPACRVGPAPGAPACGVRIGAARYDPGPDAAIMIDLELAAAGGAMGHAIDLYLDGDAAFTAALRTALLAGGGADGPASARPCSAMIRSPGRAEWHCLPRWPIAATGLDPAEALLPRPPGAHAGLALLREFFAFPARFNVLRLDLSHFGGEGRWTLGLPMPDSGALLARLLEALHANHLHPGWTACACLQRAAATPIPVDGRRSEYLLSVAPGQEIFSIDRVHLDGAAQPGWVARRVAGAVPGHEWRIAFASGDARPAIATASVDLTCCERSAVLARPERGAGARWQLNSLLALEHLPQDAAALREVMATQAISGSPAAQAIIQAILKLELRPALLRAGRAAPLPGTELRLQIDEEAFTGSGLLLFAQAMDRFFGECAHLNTFTRLVLVSARTGEELTRCRARNAGILLD